MDPDTLWLMILEAIKDIHKDGGNPHTRLHAKDCLEQLGMWLYRGGFPPTLE